MTDQIILLAFLILAMSQLTMTIYFWWQSRQNEKKLSQAGQESQERSWDLVHGAIKKSEAIVGAAEISEVKMAADSRFRLEKMEEKYEQEVANSAAEVAGAFKIEVAQAAEDLKKTLGELGSLAAESERAREKAVSETVERTLTGFDSQIKQSVAAIADKGLAQTDSQVAATRAEIEAYQKRQLAKIDEKVVKVWQKTLALILPKKLKPDEQMDLVFEALNQAKAEEFIS